MFENFISVGSMLISEGIGKKLAIRKIQQPEIRGLH
jgi:hypothetical protein